MKSEKFYNKFRIALLSAFMVVWVLKKVIIFEFLMSHLVTYAFFGASVILLVYDLFTKRRFLTGKALYALLAFLVAILLSIFVNIKYGFVENMATFGFIAIQIALFYSSTYSLTKDDIKREIFIVGKVLVYTYSIFAFFLVTTYLLNLQYDVFIGESYLDFSEYYNQGFHMLYGRVFGLFYYPATVIISVASIGLLFYFYVDEKRKSKKVWYAFVGIINFLAIVLCGARAVQYAFYIFVAFLVLVSLKKKWFLKCAAAVLSVILVFGVSLAVQKTIPYLQTAIYNVMPGQFYGWCDKAIENVYGLSGYKTVVWTCYSYVDPNTGETIVDKNSLKLQDVERYDLEGKEVTNSRAELWSDAISIWKSAPIFGTSPRNFFSYAEEYFPDSNITKTQRPPHNSYLDLLDFTGILGFIAMFGSGLWIGIYLLKNLKKSKDAGVFVSVNIAFLAYMMVESDVFLYYNIQSFVFWWILGLAGTLVKLEEENEKISDC